MAETKGHPAPTVGYRVRHKLVNKIGPTDGEDKSIEFIDEPDEAIYCFDPSNVEGEKRAKKLADERVEKLNGEARDRAQKNGDLWDDPEYSVKSVTGLEMTVLFGLPEADALISRARTA